MIQLLTLSLASPHTNLSLFSLLQPDVPSVSSSSKPGSLSPQGLYTSSPFCLKVLSPGLPMSVSFSPFKSSPLRCSR